MRGMGGHTSHSLRLAYSSSAHRALTKLPSFLSTWQAGYNSRYKSTLERAQNTSREREAGVGGFAIPWPSSFTIVKRPLGSTHLHWVPVDHELEVVPTSPSNPVQLLQRAILRLPMPSSGCELQGKCGGARWLSCRCERASVL